MDPFFHEIIHTELGSASAATIRGLIVDEPPLSIACRPWDRSDLPPAATLFAAVVILTEDLAESPCAKRVEALVRRGFPVIPIVESRSTYDFAKAPLPVLSTMNAVGLDEPDRVAAALMHHGGLCPAGTGGQVFISYARNDGDELAAGLDAGLQAAGFRSVRDVREIAGGVAIQGAIHREIDGADLLILVDSRGAAASPWVARELDWARVAHIPVLAVTPTKSAFHHHLRTPHVPWEESDELAAVVDAAVIAARRILARKLVFRDRVARTLDRVCKLRRWALREERDHWHVRLTRDLRVECCDDTPAPEAVISLLDALTGGRGMLVGGTRPYHPKTARAFARLGGEEVCVTPLSRVASRIPERVAAPTLAGRRIFLSAAMPDDDDTELAASTLAPFVITFIQTMVELGATVVFGGHPSVTPMVHGALVEIAVADGRGVELHQAEMWAESLPSEAEDRRIFPMIHWYGDGSDAATDIAALRDGMITAGLDAAVFVGGKTKTSLTPKAGIIDEFDRFREACPDKPAFVLGLAGGAARALLDRGDPPRSIVDRRVSAELEVTTDPDLATALIVAELLER